MSGQETFGVRAGRVSGGQQPATAPDSAWDGDEVAMVFDGHSGNAVDSFSYTAEELQRRADELRGTVTVDPSPFLLSSTEATPSPPKACSSCEDIDSTLSAVLEECDGLGRRLAEAEQALREIAQSEGFLTGKGAAKIARRALVVLGEGDRQQDAQNKPSP